MAKINASIPQGTRDFGPETVRKRNYIFNTIRTVFELYGFQPLETPAMENIETLMGKYGDEGDKLIFKILNNGLNDPKNREKAKTGFENVLAGKNDPALTERALRYDLTIPFARYVAMNHGQLTLPFRRYQMQPVWRADRPQKGRYREFYQCDADVVGSSSLLNEVELALIYATVFKLLGIPVDIKINNRKILAALAALCGGSDQLINITIAIDKLDKIGIEKVKEELLERGLSAAQVNVISDYLEIKGNNREKLERIKTILGNNETGQEGITEIESVLNLLSQAVAPANQHSEQTIHDSPLTIDHSPFTIDFTLARGLNYYTGIIFEIKAQKVQIGSIGGGGRYDNLTGTFGVPGVAGAGISFGVDRIYDVMEELQLFPAAVQTGTQVLFFNLGSTESAQAFILMQALREKGVRSEIYHELAKFDKQFKYAEKKNIAHAVIIGSTELADHTCTIKNLQTGKQETIAQQSLINYSF